MSIRVSTNTSNISVRVGQENAIKVLSSAAVGGDFASNSGTSINVVGGIASVSQLNVSGISTFVGVSTFKDNVYVSGITKLNGDLEVDGPSQFDGRVYINSQIFLQNLTPFGVVFIDDQYNLTSIPTDYPILSETNVVLTKDESGAPIWANSIDGGTY